MDRAQLLTQKLLKQGYVDPRLKSSLQKSNGRQHHPVHRCNISITKKSLRYQRGNQNPYIEEQTTQWPKWTNNDQQNTYKTKDRV